MFAVMCTLVRSSGGSKRKHLEWWVGTADVYRLTAAGSDTLQEKPVRLDFHAEDAVHANAAMLSLVDELLLPMFCSAPETLVIYWSGSKRKGKKRMRDAGGLDNESATHYERMLAVINMINLLDVWRRNSAEFLC